MIFEGVGTTFGRSIVSFGRLLVVGKKAEPMADMHWVYSRQFSVGEDVIFREGIDKDPASWRESDWPAKLVGHKAVEHASVLVDIFRLCYF